MGKRWRIKARIIKRSERRTWKNERGEGYLINVEMMDEDGTKIQGTFFKDMVDKFEGILHENRGPDQRISSEVCNCEKREKHNYRAD